MSNNAPENVRRLIDLLKPKTVLDRELIRVGSPNDGGYVMLKPRETQKKRQALSFGIGYDWSWDEVMARDYNYEIFMCDDGDCDAVLPGCWFSKVKLDGYVVNHLFQTYKFKDIIWKMDVEGSEWGIFHRIKDEYLEQCEQILLELHFTCDYHAWIPILEKINKTHQSFMVQPNNCQGKQEYDDFDFAAYVEVSFVRRKDHQFAPYDHSKVLPLLGLNVPEHEPVTLNWVK